jgi:hypothetical protein
MLLLMALYIFSWISSCQLANFIPIQLFSALLTPLCKVQRTLLISRDNVFLPTQFIQLSCVY